MDRQAMWRNAEPKLKNPKRSKKDIRNAKLEHNFKLLGDNPSAGKSLLDNEDPTC